jgi:CheY-like chemotaxis protein
MDHMMPEMDGIETVARIRALGDADPYYKNVPIIALTANAVSGTKEMFLANGFNDFISKPIEMAHLNSILEKWVPKEKRLKRAGAIGTDGIGKASEISIEGLDTAKGLAMAGGSQKNYIGTLEIFLRDGKKKIAEINAALETNNLPLFKIYAHALKSAAANIGAMELSELANALEIAGERNDLGFVQEHAPSLLDSLGRAMGAISKAMDTGANGKQELMADMGELKRLLARLKEAIDGVDPAGIKATSEALKPFAKAEGVGEALESILARLQGGEDDEASDEIDSLIGSL